MNPLQQIARRARRRLWLNRGLATLGWALAAAAAAFIAVVLMDRLWLAADGAGGFPYGWLASSLLGAAVVAAIIWSASTRESLARAATRLDEAAGLKARISSGVHCEGQADPFARAVVADADRATRRVSMRQHLPIVFPRSGGYAGGSAIVALLVFWLLPTVDLAGKQERRQEDEQRQELMQQVRSEIEPVVRQRVEAIRRKHPDLDKELAELEPEKDRPAEKPSDLRTEPIKKINKVGDKLEERRESVELGKVEEFGKLARRLAGQQKLDSPVGKLARGLEGDLKAAQQALNEIEQALAKTPTTDQEKQQSQELRQQVEQLSAKLEQIGQDQRKAKDDLADAGLTPEEVQQALDSLDRNDPASVAKTLEGKGMPAGEVSKLLRKLAQSKAACKAAEKLAQNLKTCTQCEQQSGEMSDSAQAALAEAAQQLSEMEGLAQELSQIDSAMADLDSLKQQLTRGCSDCQGTGQKNGQPCPTCQGTGMKPGQNRDGGGHGGREWGLGSAQGRMAAGKTEDFNVAQEREDLPAAPGKIITTKFVDGEPIIDELSPEFVEAAIADHRRVTDAIARDELPRIYHRSLKKYFDHSVEHVTGQPDEP